MTEYSRPATIDDVKRIIRALNEQGAEYLLIGGYALFAHGYHRTTEDIDLLVPATRHAAEKFRRALIVLQDRAIENVPPEWFEEGENIRIADEIVVDLMFNACGETYTSLERYAEAVDLDGISVRTVSLEGLLRTKQSGRAKDAADRAVLEHALELIRKG
jgi:predicted nucleotidyltransferase